MFKTNEGTIDRTLRVIAGLALIGWPDVAKKGFLAQLLPAHAEALKAQQQIRQLDYNLLVKQIDAIRSEHRDPAQ